MSEPLPEHVLVKAAGEGRIRGIALQTWAEAKADPWGAGRCFREGLRQARALHSRERRLVRDALYAMVRSESRWAFVLGTDAPVVLWLAWLVEQGLPVALAVEQADAPFHRLVDGSLEVELERLDPVRALAVRHGLPEGIVQCVAADRGLEGAARLLAASDARAPVTVRANLALNDRQSLARRLAEEGIETRPCARALHGLHVLGRANLAGSRAHQQGRFEVQDEGSQLMAALVPSDAERVLDFCAGAGGKSLALAAVGLEVLATDVRRGALGELGRRAHRAGVRIRRQEIPEEGPLPDVLARFAPRAVLVDAPCSGLGVLRRHPEHRWQLGDEVLARRAALQSGILRRAATLVPVGGLLVYGTCSVLPSENQEVVDAFLGAHPDFVAAGPPLRTAPDPEGTDGFYAQPMERIVPLQSTPSHGVR